MMGFCVFCSLIFDANALRIHWRLEIEWTHKLSVSCDESDYENSIRRECASLPRFVDPFACWVALICARDHKMLLKCISSASTVLAPFVLLGKSPSVKCCDHVCHSSLRTAFYGSFYTIWWVIAFISFFFPLFLSLFTFYSLIYYLTNVCQEKWMKLVQVTTQQNKTKAPSIQAHLSFLAGFSFFAGEKNSRETSNGALNLFYLNKFIRITT